MSGGSGFELQDGFCRASGLQLHPELLGSQTPGADPESPAVSGDPCFRPSVIHPSLSVLLLLLRSGQDGFYPHLIQFCEKHIEELDPKSRVLRKENRVSSVSGEERRSICEDLQVLETHLSHVISQSGSELSPVLLHSSHE